MGDTWCLAYNYFSDRYPAGGYLLDIDGDGCLA